MFFLSDSQQLPYSKQEIQQGKLVSVQEMKIEDKDNALTKVKKIATYLVQHFHHQLGNPKQNMFTLTPWQQFEAIRNQKAEFYCTQYSDMFAFFARINQLSCRQIESKGTRDRHIFNETYIPELKQWVYTDLTLNIIWATHQQQPIDFITFSNMLFQVSDYDSVETVTQDSIKRLPFRSVLNHATYFFDQQTVYFYYKISDLQLAKSGWYKFKSSILNQPFALLYSHKTVFAYGFILKYIAVLIIVFVLRKIYSALLL